MEIKSENEQKSGYEVLAETEERVILFAAAMDGVEVSETEKSLDELEELLKTAGAQSVGRLIQSRDRAASDLYLGRGKVEELRSMIAMYDATGVVCDDELSPAQLKFRATRLVGMRDSLSRLGGGIGTRGPGEKKLEIDRRVIRDRISKLKADLRQVENRRTEQRKQRSRTGIPVISIVGYTNAGKSTLLNKLTDAGVLEEDKLFATLDPATRNAELPAGQQVLFTDTVGFIRKLPHHLVEAFKSTLEEARYSDVILHVVDASDPNWDDHVATVYTTLRQLNIDDEKGRPVITVFNKIDKLPEDADQSSIKDLRADRMVYMSARTGAGIPELLSVIEEVLREQKTYIRHTFSYQEAGKPGLIRKYGEMITEEYLEDGIFVEAYVPKSLIGQIGLSDED